MNDIVVAGNEWLIIPKSIAPTCHIWFQLTITHREPNTF